MSIDPLLSPGWGHYILVAPLSPKARVNLNRKLRQFSDRDQSFRALPSHALSLPLLDLGVVSEAIEPRIVSILSRLVPTCASLQIHSSGWAVDVNEAEREATLQRANAGSSSSPSFLWLNWEDRLGMLTILRRELERELSDLCADMERVKSQASPTSTQKKREHFSVLCGYFSSFKSDACLEKFKSSAWLNEICLQKRPQRFHPSDGYQSVWRHALPFETPELDEHDLDPLTVSSRLTAQESSGDPLTGRALELFNLLERRLETSLQPSSPSSSSKSPRRRRRRPRNKKRSS